MGEDGAMGEDGVLVEDGESVGDNVTVLPLQAANTKTNTREATKTADNRFGRPHQSINDQVFEWGLIALNQRFEEALTYRRVNST